MFLERLVESEGHCLNDHLSTVVTTLNKGRALQTILEHFPQRSPKKGHKEHPMREPLQCLEVSMLYLFGVALHGADASLQLNALLTAKGLDADDFDWNDKRQLVLRFDLDLRKRPFEEQHPPAHVLVDLTDNLQEASSNKHTLLWDASCPSRTVLSSPDLQHLILEYLSSVETATTAQQVMHVGLTVLHFGLACAAFAFPAFLRLSTLRDRAAIAIRAPRRFFMPPITAAQSAELIHERQLAQDGDAQTQVRAESASQTVAITVSDLARILKTGPAGSSGWLSNQIIDAHFDNLRVASLLPSGTVIAGTFFIQKLLDGLNVSAQKGYRNVCRWFKRERLVGMKITRGLGLVANTGGNHYVAVFADMKSRVVEVMDSLSSSPSLEKTSCASALLHFLHLESISGNPNCLIEAPIDMGNWNVVHVQCGHGQVAPSQHNGYDCGMFALRWLEHRAMDVVIEYDQTSIERQRLQLVLELKSGRLLRDIQEVTLDDGNLHMKMAGEGWKVTLGFFKTGCLSLGNLKDKIEGRLKSGAGQGGHVEARLRSPPFLPCNHPCLLHSPDPTHPHLHPRWLAQTCQCGEVVR